MTQEEIHEIKYRTMTLINGISYCNKDMITWVAKTVADQLFIKNVNDILPIVEETIKLYFDIINNANINVE